MQQKFEWDTDLATTDKFTDGIQNFLRQDGVMKHK